MAKNAKLITSGIAAVIAIGAAVYIGAKVYRQIDDLNFDNIFEDMNESFFASMPRDNRDE